MRPVSASSGVFRRPGTRALAASFVTLVTLSAASPFARAGEQIILPYDCSVRNGRVVAEPSSDQAYRIYGPRERQAHRACSSSTPGRCRTFMLHRFTMACGAKRVRWPEFYAAIADETDGRAYIDSGRLYMRMGPQWRDGREGRPRGFPWRHRDGYGNGDRDRRGFDEPYDYDGPGRNAVVELPPGYAPLSGTRAIFTELDPRIAEAEDLLGSRGPDRQGGAPEWDDNEFEARGGTARPREEAAGDVPSGWAASPRPPALEKAEVPPPQRKPDATADPKSVEAPGSKSDTKSADPKPVMPDVKTLGKTEIAAAPGTAATAEPAKPNAALAEKKAEGTSSPAVPATSFAPTILNNPSAPKPAAPAPEPESVAGSAAPAEAPAAPTPPASGSTSVTPSVTAVELPNTTTETSTGGAATVTAPQSETVVAAVEQSPEAIETGTVAPSPAAGLMSWQSIAAGAAGLLLLASLLMLRRQSSQPAVRGGARRRSAAEPVLPGLPMDAPGRYDAGTELMVVPQSEPAAAAQPAPPSPSPNEPVTFVVPKTRSEALAVLGLSGAANDVMIGKVVDALRQSWHPDTAASEDERRMREARLKQINVAADLLAGTKA